MNSYSYFSKKHDVLAVYEDLDKQSQSSLLTGGMDTGIDFGKFLIDTSNNIGPTTNQN